MSDMFDQEIADVLANQEFLAESQKTKKAKVYNIKYYINIRSVNCKRLLLQSTSVPLRPYVVFKVLGSEKEAITSVHENTRNPVYTDVMKIDGYCVGSDLLKVLVFDCNGEVPNMAEDRCIGYAHLPICELELGQIIQHTFKLYKSRDGKPMKDKVSREGSAGTVTCEFHLADLGSISWKPQPWEATYYRAWVHIMGAENVPEYDGKLSNPYLMTKISPASNMQRQNTSTCIGTDAPVWNELHCYMADDYQHQIISFKLCHNAPDGQKVVLAKTSFQLSMAKPNQITSHNLSMNDKTEDPKLKKQSIGQKGCVLKLRVQLLEKNKVPFDGLVAFKHNLFNCECQVIEGKEITAKPGDKPVAAVSIEKNQKLTKPAENNTTPQWGDTLRFTRVMMSQYLVIDVRSAHHKLGQARIHLTRFPIDQDTDGWYNLTDAATGAVRLRIKLTRYVEREFDDNDDTHCHFNWNLDLTSDYSTDFTGYSQCSRSLSLNPSSNSERFHYEEYHNVDIYDEKPIRDQSITGTLVNGSSIFKWENAKSLYAVVSLHGRIREKHFKVQSNETDNFETPEFNTPIDFPRVKKGDSIFVTIFEKLENGTVIPVCEGSKLTKELAESGNVELILEQPRHSVKPKELSNYPPLESFGKVNLNLNSKVSFR